MQPIQSEMIKHTTNCDFLQDFADECYVLHWSVVL